MQAAAKTSLFLTGCSSKAGCADAESVVSNDGLPHGIVASHLIRTATSQELFLKLTTELIQSAERAYTLRNLSLLEEVSRVLMNLPVDASRQIGLYYHALALNRRGYRDVAETLFAAVADNAPITFRARAIQTLGANYLDRGQPDETLRFQIEALRAASDKHANGLQTTLMAHGEIAVVRSLAGDHKGALANIENLWPLACHVAKQHPFYFYLFQNELAVELNEVGRVEEAEAACKVAINSPFASAYPEWTETRDEIAAKRVSATPSVVAVRLPPQAAPLPQADRVRKSKPASRLAFKRPVCKGTVLQRASTTIAVTAATFIDATTQSILDRMLICCAPRAPPILS